MATKAISGMELWHNTELGKALAKVLPPQLTRVIIDIPVYGAVKIYYASIETGPTLDLKWDEIIERVEVVKPKEAACCLPSDKVWKFNPLDEIKGKDDLLKKSLFMLRHYFNRHGTLYEYTPTETAQHLLNIGDVLKCKMQDAVRKDSQGERGPQPETADTPAAEMLGDMQVLKLSPRDVIVLKYPGVLCEKAWENIKKSMAEMFPDNHCIILEEGMDIRVVAKISEPEEPTPPPVEEYSEADVKP